MPEAHRVPEVHPTYRNAQAITTNDSTELPTWCRAIYVGGAGNIVLVTVEGNTVTLTGVLVGTVYPIAAKIVKATLTTATNLVALW